jgi:hypothetical protein
MDVSPYFQPFFQKPTFIQPLFLLSSGLIGLITIGIATLDRSTEELDRSFALLLVAAQLINPLGWIYYSWIGFGPLIALGISRYKIWRAIRWDYLKITTNILLIITAGGFLTPLPLLVAFQPNAFLTLTLGSAYFWATLALWTILVIDWGFTSQPILSSNAAKCSKLKWI